MTEKVKYPSLTPITSDSQLRSAVNSIIGALAPLTGQHRDKDNQAITWLDFAAAGYSLRRGDDGWSMLPPPVVPELPDMTVPPDVVGFAAAASFNYVTLSWSQPAYRNHSHVEVWRAEGFKTVGTGPNIPTVLGDAVFRLMAPSIMASDTVLPGDVWRYWARNVSNTGVAGAWTSVDGLLVEVPESPSYLIDKISGEIREGDLYPALGNKIDVAYDGYYSNSTAIQQQSLLLSTHSQTLASQGTAIQQQSQIITAQGALINAAYTVRIDSGKAVSGFGLMVDGASGRSDFIIRSDRFAIAAPQQYDQSGKPILDSNAFPFIVDVTNPAAPKTLIRNAYIDKAYIESLVTGTLVADKITGQTISGTHIRGGDISIGSRFSVDSAGNAVIRNASVDGVVTATSLTATSSVSIGAVSGAGTYMTRDRIDVRDDAGVLRVRIGRL